MCFLTTFLLMHAILWRKITWQTESTKLCSSLISALNIKAALIRSNSIAIRFPLSVFVEEEDDKREEFIPSPSRRWVRDLGAIKFAAYQTFEICIKNVRFHLLPPTPSPSFHSSSNTTVDFNREATPSLFWKSSSSSSNISAGKFLLLFKSPPYP